MGKNIKSYATTQVHFPREREGSLTAKSPNLLAKIRLNRTHSFLKITGKSFQIYPLSFSKISSKLSRIRSIRPHH